MVLLCILFISVSSVSTRCLPFLFFIVPVFGQNVPLIFPVFLKRYLVFLLLFSSCFMYCSLKKAILSLCSTLWNSSFSWMCLSLSPLLFISLLSSAICKASLPSYFSLGWFCLLPPVQYYGPPSIVLQAHCLEVLIP